MDQRNINKEVIPERDRGISINMPYHRGTEEVTVKYSSSWCATDRHMTEKMVTNWWVFLPWSLPQFLHVVWWGVTGSVTWEQTSGGCVNKLAANQERLKGGSRWTGSAAMSRWSGSTYRCFRGGCGGLRFDVPLFDVRLQVDSRVQTWLQRELWMVQDVSRCVCVSLQNYN